MKDNQSWMQTRINLLKVISWMILMLAALICVVIVAYSIANSSALSRLPGLVVQTVGLAIIFVFGFGGVLAFVGLQNLAAMLQTILNIEINTEDTAEAVGALSGSVDRLITLLEQRADARQIGNPQ